MNLRALAALAFFTYACYPRVDANAGTQDTAPSEFPLSRTAMIKFEAKLFREPDVGSEVIARVPVGAEVKLVGAPKRENFRTPSVFVEIVYESHRGFVTDPHLDKTDPRFLSTLHYLRGEHELLVEVVKSGQMGEVRRGLQSASSVVNYRDDNGWTALMFASRDGSHSIVDLLLRQGADPNLRNDKGETSLLLAAKYGHVNVVQELLGLDDVDLDATDHGGRSAYTWALAANVMDTVELLKNAGATAIDTEGDMPPYVVAGGVTAPKLTDGPILDARSRPERIHRLMTGRSELAAVEVLEDQIEGLEWQRSWDDHHVVVEIIVHRDGTTSFVRFIQKPYEDEKLDQKFVEATEDHEFEPAMLHGSPVDAKWVLTFEMPP
jgi:hypothetical protein